MLLKSLGEWKWGFLPSKSSTEHCRHHKEKGKDTKKESKRGAKLTERSDQTDAQSEERQQNPPGKHTLPELIKQDPSGRHQDTQRMNKARLCSGAAAVSDQMNGPAGFDGNAPQIRRPRIRGQRHSTTHHHGLGEEAAANRPAPQGTQSLDKAALLRAQP
jgi:hypothetical protein